MKIAIHVQTTGETRNPIGSVASLDMWTAVCGYVHLTRDGEVIDDLEHPRRRWFRRRESTLRAVERYARKHPGAYKIVFNAPLWSATFRRVRPGKWICVEAGKGFA